MSITRRVRKNGSVVYEIRISRGRDPVTGKQLAPFTTTYAPPPGCTEAKAKKLALKQKRYSKRNAKTVRSKSKARRTESRMSI